MKRHFIIMLLILLCLHSHAELYLVFEENGKVGLKNEEGAVLLPASFEALGWSDGSFSVIGKVTGYKLGNRWGIINLEKEFISKAEFESILYTGGDRIIAFKKLGPTISRFGCLDLAGKIKVPFKYDGITIQGLRAVVFIKNGTRFEHGLIDLQDHEIIPLKFKNINPIGSLRYAVENFENKTALFTEEGKKLTDFLIDSISAFHKGKAVIYQELKQGLIDREGEIKIQSFYREIKIDEDGTVRARPFDEWRVLDGENHELKKIPGDELETLANGLYRITVSGKMGVMDENFNSIIAPIYDELTDFHVDKMIARFNGKYGLLRKDGSEVLPFTFDSLQWDGKFIKAKERVSWQAGWNLYDTFGIKKTIRPYDFIGSYNGKYFLVHNNDYQGAINRYGEELMHCVYDSVIEFKEELHAMKFQGQYGIIALDENWLVAPQPFPIKLVNEEKYIELRPNNTSLKTFTGNIIYFTDNKFVIESDYLREFLPDGTEKLVSLNGQTISRTSSESTVSGSILRASEGLQGIERDGLYGFVDDLGRLRIANRYEGIGQFKEGLAPVKILGKWGFVDTHDNIAINPNYESAQEFDQGLAIVKSHEKTGIINKEGKIILPLRYDSVKKLMAEKYLIISETRHGLADNSGIVLIEPQFDKIENLFNGYVLIERDNKFGLLTVDGISTIPLMYDKLVYDHEKNRYLALKKAEWLNLNY